MCHMRAIIFSLLTLLAFACSKAEQLDAMPDQYVGIGVELRMEAAGASVVRVFKEGPAKKSGVSPGDIILAVAGQPLRGLNLADVVSRIRGAPGTSVELLVRQKDGEQSMQVERNALRN